VTLFGGQPDLFRVFRVIRGYGFMEGKTTEHTENTENTEEENRDNKN